MILEVQHETKLEYTGSVTEWLAELRMQPISDESQTCHSFHITVNQPTTVFRYLDGFGNHVHHFNLLAPKPQLRVLAASIVETADGIEHLADSQTVFPLDQAEMGGQVLDFLQLRGPIRNSALLKEVLAELQPQAGQRVGAWIEQVASYIRDRFEYARDVTDSSSPIDDVLEQRKGVCQDFAHLTIAILRSFGVPARYASGYIHRPNQESESHAWCEALLPDIGWIGIDPTNGCEVTEQFVRVASGRDYTDVPPNKGTRRGTGDERISVRVATRELVRLPSVLWHEHLQPINVPETLISRRLPLADTTEQQQQQQQQ